MSRLVKVTKWEKHPEHKHFEQVPDGVAVFHQFGSDIEEYHEGAATYSTAIIERKNGTVENVPVGLIQFIEPHPELLQEQDSE